MGTVEPQQDFGDFIDDDDDDDIFDDREWERCCCGMCSSSICSCCKHSLILSFYCCNVTGAILSSICGPCATCYSWCDRKRPRPDCCGVKKKGEQNQNIDLDNNPVAN